MITPRKLSNITTELAKARNRAATERTLTSWIQSCLILIGFGTAFEQILAAVDQSFPENTSAINLQIADAIGLSTIGLGILLLVLVIVEYRLAIKSLARADYLYRPLRLHHLSVLVGMIVLYGLAAIVAVLIVH